MINVLMEPLVEGGSAVIVGTIVGGWVGTAVAVGDGVIVGSGVSVAVAVGIGVNVAVGKLVGVADRVNVGSDVAVGVRTASKANVGTGTAAPTCTGTGNGDIFSPAPSSNTIIGRPPTRHSPKQRAFSNTRLYAPRRAGIW
jgi:hypothetical protein